MVESREQMKLHTPERRRREKERIEPRMEGSGLGTLHEQLHLMFLLLGESGTVIGPKCCLNREELWNEADLGGAKCWGVQSLFRGQHKAIWNLELVSKVTDTHGVCGARCRVRILIYLLYADCGVWGMLLSCPRSDFCYVEWFDLATAEFWHCGVIFDGLRG